MEAKIIIFLFFSAIVNKIYKNHPICGPKNKKNRPPERTVLGQSPTIRQNTDTQPG